MRHGRWRAGSNAHQSLGGADSTATRRAWARTLRAVNYRGFAQQSFGKKFPLKSRRFFFHFRGRLPKLGGLKAKWTTSSRRKNCRLSASISMSSSGRTTAAGSCGSPRKLTAAATASSFLARALMSLRRQLLKFLRTAKPPQLNRCTR